MTQQPINRCLSNKSMDYIDHALGRPLDPMAKTYRNFFATDGDLADEMAASPYWREGISGRELRYFAVTDEGRKALAAYLRESGDKHRAYDITFDGHVRTVVATSRSKARYSDFLDVREVRPDLSFKDYCSRASVRAV